MNERDAMNESSNKEKVIVRARSGVFFGRLERHGNNGRIYDVRRLWHWDGAASLSELAVKGPSKPENCKFPTPVTWIDVSDIIEVLPVTERAQAAIDAVPIWTAH